MGKREWKKRFASEGCAPTRPTPNCQPFHIPEANAHRSLRTPSTFRTCQEKSAKKEMQEFREYYGKRQIRPTWVSPSRKEIYNSTQENSKGGWRLIMGHDPGKKHIRLAMRRGVSWCDSVLQHLIGSLVCAGGVIYIVRSAMQWARHIKWSDLWRLNFIYCVLKLCHHLGACDWHGMREWCTGSYNQHAVD